MEEKFKRLEMITLMCYPKHYLGGEERQITKEDLSLYYECLIYFKEQEQIYQETFNNRRLLSLKLHEMAKILQEFSEQLSLSLRKSKNSYELKRANQYEHWLSLLDILSKTLNKNLKIIKIASYFGKSNKSKGTNTYEYIGIISDSIILNELNSDLIYQSPDVINIFRKIYKSSNTLIIGTTYNNLNMIIPNVWPNPKVSINTCANILGYRLNELEINIMTKFKDFLINNNYDLDHIKEEDIINYLKPKEMVKALEK